MCPPHYYLCEGSSCITAPTMTSASAALRASDTLPPLPICSAAKMWPTSWVCLFYRADFNAWLCLWAARRWSSFAAYRFQSFSCLLHKVALSKDAMFQWEIVRYIVWKARDRQTPFNMLDGYSDCKQTSEWLSAPSRRCAEPNRQR